MHAHERPTKISQTSDADSEHKRSEIERFSTFLLKRTNKVKSSQVK